MKQGESANWSFNPEQFADLASSLNNFFTQVGGNSPRQNNVTHQYDPLAGNYLHVLCLFGSKKGVFSSLE